MGRYIEEDDQGNRYIVDDGEDSPTPEQPPANDGMGAGIRSGIEGSNDEVIYSTLKQAFGDVLRGPPKLMGVITDAATYPIRETGYLAGMKGPFFEESLPTSKGIEQYMTEQGFPRRNSLQQRVLENITPIGLQGTLAQIVAGGGSGVGEYVAENSFPESKTAQALLPILGAISPGMAAKGLAKASKSGAEAFERGSLGIGKSALEKSEKSLPKSMQGKGEAPLIKAVERARTEGNLNTMALSPDEGIQKIVEIQQEIGNELTNVLSKADEARGTFSATPTWSNVEDFIQGQSGTKKEAAKKAFAAEKELLLETATPEIDGSLRSLQEAKVKWNDIAYKAAKAQDYETESLAKAMVKDMKEAIEDSVNNLAKEGKIDPALEDSIKQLNRRYGDYEMLRPFLISQEAKSLTDVVTRLGPKIATTGGLFALPHYTGMLMDEPGLGTMTGLILSALNTSPGKLGAAKVLRGTEAIAAPSALNNEALKKILASTIQRAGG